MIFDRFYDFLVAEIVSNRLKMEFIVNSVIYGMRKSKCNIKNHFSHYQMTHNLYLNGKLEYQITHFIDFHLSNDQ